MKLIVVESPYAGDVEANLEFARRACRFVCDQGHAPIASHLLYTQFLDDDIPKERAQGIESGLAWAKHADEAWFFLRRDEIPTSGMHTAMNRHVGQRRTIEIYEEQEDGKLMGVTSKPAGTD